MNSCSYVYLYVQSTRYLEVVCTVDSRYLEVDVQSTLVILKSYVQSTLVISKSKGPSETLQDIRTSIYQICRIDENTN